jgi:hypothetical protein
MRVPSGSTAVALLDRRQSKSAAEELHATPLILQKTSLHRRALCDVATNNHHPASSSRARAFGFSSSRCGPSFDAPAQSRRLGIVRRGNKQSDDAAGRPNSAAGRRRRAGYTAPAD